MSALQETSPNYHVYTIVTYLVLTYSHALQDNRLDSKEYVESAGACRTDRAAVFRASGGALHRSVAGKPWSRPEVLPIRPPVPDCTRYR